MNDEPLLHELESARQMRHRGSITDVAVKYALTLTVAVIVGFVLRWWLT
jgi:hypothetical protein